LQSPVGQRHLLAVRFALGTWEGAEGGGRSAPQSDVHADTADFERAPAGGRFADDEPLFRRSIALLDGVAAPEPVHRAPHGLRMERRLERPESTLEREASETKGRSNWYSVSFSFRRKGLNKPSILIIGRVATPTRGGCPAASKTSSRNRRP
jgi:hypothetical protein